MKIGTCVSLSSMEGISEKLKLLRENHFDSCQLISWNPSVWTDENAVTLKKLLTQYEITVSAFWCGWEGPRIWDFYDGQLTLGLIPPEYRQMRIQNLCMELILLISSESAMWSPIWDSFRKTPPIPILTHSVSLCVP